MASILFIGGTGVISTACAELAARSDFEVTVLNRGQRDVALPEGVRSLVADARDESALRQAIAGKSFDVVADFIAFNVPQVERDIRLFSGHVGQYIFISSASAYQKPVTHPVITESTPLANPFWQYSRDKIACENRLMDELRANGFPATIIRPSLTYGDTVLPMALGSWHRSWTILDRMIRGVPILMHGDGTSLWVSTHNSDFAKGFAGLANNPRAIGHAFHITSDEVLSWRQHYEIFGASVGAKPIFHHVTTDRLCELDPNLVGPLRGDKSPSVMFDNSKIKSFVPGFAATMPLWKGVERTVRCFRADPKKQAIDDEFNAYCDRIIEQTR